MPQFKYRASGTYIIASQGTGVGEVGYQVTVTPRESWVGSLVFKQNTAPPGSVPVYVDVAYQDANTGTEVAAGTAITDTAAIIISPTVGDLVVVYTHTTGEIVITVNPATRGVTNRELMTAFLAAGYETAGQDTTEAMLSVAVADMLGTTLNVKAFGAVGDGVTDDTAAIQAAIDAAASGWTSGDPFGYGGVVFFPKGVYGVSADIDIPEQVLLQGSGLRVTILRWIGAGSPVDAVVTSNIDNRFSFVHATGIKDLSIDANDEAVGLKIRGWNEACQLENVEVREYTDATDGGVQILSASPGSNTSTSQNVHFKGLWFGGKTGARNLLLDGCNRLTFDNVTIFLSNYDAVTNTGPMLTGIELRQVCRQNVFINPNVEDCTRAYDIGTTAAVSGNTFINPLSDAPVGLAPADTTIGSVTGSMGFVVRSTAGATWGQIVGGMRSRFYDYVYFDDALGITIAGAGGSNYSNLTGYFGPASGIYTTPHISRHATFTDADATPSVARGNLFSANNSGATSITAFDDGTEFQEITIRFTNSNTTVVDAAGVIELAGGVNFSGTSNDTLTLIRYGTTWYEKARSVN